MSEPVFCTFEGGPWDGQMRANPKLVSTIDVSLLQGPADARSVKVGTYRRTETRIGGAWRYEWQEPAK